MLPQSLQPYKYYINCDMSRCFCDYLLIYEMSDFHIVKYEHLFVKHSGIVYLQLIAENGTKTLINYHVPNNNYGIKKIRYSLSVICYVANSQCYCKTVINFLISAFCHIFTFHHLASHLYFDVSMYTDRL